MKKKKEILRQKGKPIVQFDLATIDVDNLGRVIIQDKAFARLVKRLKSKRVKFLAANEYCLPDSFCPPDVSGDKCGGHPNIGCGCPSPDTMCTCVAQCGCQLSLCNCA
jgi:hypothetical protein